MAGSQGWDMTTRFTQAADEVAAGIGLIREGVPDAVKAFGSLALAATTSRALDAKTKELMGPGDQHRGALRGLRRLPHD
jgi:hypothetical protein